LYTINVDLEIAYSARKQIDYRFAFRKVAAAKYTLLAATKDNLSQNSQTGLSRPSDSDSFRVCNLLIYLH
jgi:hypothetical protein